MKKTKKITLKRYLALLLIVTVVIISIIFYYLGYKLTIENYTNTKSQPSYKISYPKAYKLVEDFSEEEPGVWKNCISLRDDSVILGIAIHGNHHPCYISTGGSPDQITEKKYALQSANSVFNVTESRQIYNEIDQYGDYHDPDDRTRTTIYGEGANGMYFVYSDSEANFYKNINTIKSIISTITWIN